VPAVAARQERLVLVIFIRFKGYLDCISYLIKVIDNTRVWYKRLRGINSGEMKCFDTMKTDNGEGKSLCKNW
jgi:hypothetical protein